MVKTLKRKLRNEHHKISQKHNLCKSKKIKFHKKAIAVLAHNKNNITGIVQFIQKKKLEIHYEIYGLTDGEHGFHIHEYGDLTDECNSACAHFNPFHKNHGGPNSYERHVGDLGNIYFDAYGNAKIKMIDDLIKLRGTKSNIIGRAIVIHKDKDDLGLGGHSDSLTTGHAGKRVTCAVIGYSKKMFK